MTSSYHGHLDVVKLLLDSGADPGAVDLQQSTALGYAFGGMSHNDFIVHSAMLSKTLYNFAEQYLFWRRVTIVPPFLNFTIYIQMKNI